MSRNYQIDVLELYNTPPSQFPHLKYVRDDDDASYTGLLTIMVIIINSNYLLFSMCTCLFLQTML